jgi:hypothetical protein
MTTLRSSPTLLTTTLFEDKRSDGSSDSSLLGNVGSMKIDGKYFPSDILFLFLNFVCEKFLDFQKKFKELYYSSDPFMQEM